MGVGLLAFGLHKMGVNAKTVGELALRTKERTVRVTEPLGKNFHNLYTNVGARLSSAGDRLSTISLFQSRQNEDEVYDPVQYNNEAA